ncbi:MAG TPA: glutamate-1-semialdehyde 2,1-aminomutase [Spirochaetota bacterium]|nr:glutamate-1-semialdehyde 2,1-aminomutase [Spirochaetota bacterium]HPI89474.1 glutamate-1-semialdehyde 2,1-aminomutase [Spirochaetota bacterium]HPR49331.1 glutamate-1-semialdehyde 2,1-aminomutase [Spirochaetota bacterium]
MAIDKSRELYRRALRAMPGGVNSPVRAFKSVGGEPVFMKKGAGPRLFDVDGNEYIDYCMSWGPLILGHADPAVIAAVTGAAQSGTSFGTPNPFEVELADMVLERFPSIEKVRFVNSGTEAVMSAVRLARGHTGRDRIIKFDGCYHGHADHLLVAGGSGLATFGTPDSAGVTAKNASDTIVLPFNDLERLTETVEREGETIAAVIMEPLPCNYGMIPPDIDFLSGARALCDKKGILLIFDEVITGFRLARGGAQEYYGVRADLTTLGKIIGGGLPVGAYGGRADIMARIAPDGPVYQAGTLSGNPLAMAAGIATLEKLDRTGAYASLHHLGEAFAGLLKPVLQRFEGKFLVLQRESIFACYFTDKKEISSLGQVKSCDMKLFAAFHREMLSRGIYLSPSGYEVGFLCTAHGTAELEKTAQAMEESLVSVLS